MKLATIVFIVLSGLTAPAIADPEAEALLNRMNAAFAEQSYDGIFSYYSGNDLASLRVVHKVVDGVQRERLVHLNGAPREIVRNGEDVECFVMPGDELLALEESIPAGPLARAFVRSFDAVSQSYMVERFGTGRIAGRDSVRIAVSPKDEHRFGYRLWLDGGTSLLLRSELIDNRGDRLEIFQFNNIVIGNEVADEALDPGEPEGSTVSHLRLAPEQPAPVDVGATSSMDWETQWLPAGFTMAAADTRRTVATDAALSILMYSDGLASFSIFVERLPEVGAATMVSRHGATVAVTHVHRGADGEYLVTLIGEIPVATAQQIIRSVQQKS